MGVIALAFTGKSHNGCGAAPWRDVQPAQNVRGAALDSLSQSGLFERFYCWQGNSGARYICTVFPLGEHASVADFAEGVVIGVTRKGDSRRPICIVASQDFSAWDEKSLRAAAKRGVDEWHVHFTADDRAICRDLALCC